MSSNVTGMNLGLESVRALISSSQIVPIVPSSPISFILANQAFFHI